MSEQNAGAEVVRDLMQQLHGKETLTFPIPGPDRDAIPLMALPAGISIVSIKKLLDEYRLAPERRRGTDVVLDLTSFIELVNRFKDEGSALWAVRDMGKPSLMAVLNYHPEGPDGTQTRYGDHRTLYQFPLSSQWITWTTSSGVAMSQEDFAVFIENNIEDVRPIPDLLNQPLETLRQPGAIDAIDDPWERELVRMILPLGGKVADPLTLANLSREISIRSTERAEQKIDISSGQKTLSYKSEHTDDQGKAVKVPSMFIVGIPVFDGGSPCEIVVKLRYRLRSGTVMWSYELHRPDKVFQHVFNQATATAQQCTGLPLFLGTTPVAA